MSRRDVDHAQRQLIWHETEQIEVRQQFPVYRKISNFDKIQRSMADSDQRFRNNILICRVNTAQISHILVTLLCHYI